MLNDLPEDTLLNISSYLLGKPVHVKMKNNTKFMKIQKQFKIEYEKPMTFELDTDKIEMCYSITGSRLNPTILKNEENKITNFIENFVFKNYDGESYFKVVLDITFYYCKTVKTAGSFCQYDVYRGGGYFRKVKDRFVPYHLERCIEQFNREIEKHKRWQKEDTEIRQFKTENFRINVEMEKIYDDDSDLKTLSLTFNANDNVYVLNFNIIKIYPNT